MAAFNKFSLFTQDLCRGVHNFQNGSGSTFNVMLTNTAPVSTNHLYGDISANELAGGGGYSVGGASVPMFDGSSGGTETMSPGTVTWTGSGGGFGPFRYAVVYNVSATAPLKPLICWFDYGSSISLSAGDQFSVPFTSGLFSLN